MAPAFAVPRMLARNSLTLQDFDFFEIHEAFAGTVLSHAGRLGGRRNSAGTGWAWTPAGHHRPLQAERQRLLAGRRPPVCRHRRTHRGHAGEDAARKGFGPRPDLRVRRRRAGRRGDPGGALSMADKYLELVNSGFTKKLAEALGLPRPAILRRYAPGAPLVPGPVLVLGNSPGAQELADTLLGWGLDVRRHAVRGVHSSAGSSCCSMTLAAPEELSAPCWPPGLHCASWPPAAAWSRFAGRRHWKPMRRRRPPCARASTVLRSLGRRTARRGDRQRHRARRTASRPPLRPPWRRCASCFRAAAPTSTGSSSPWIPTPGPCRRTSTGRWPARSRWSPAPRAASAQPSPRTLHRDGATVVVVDVPAAGDALAKVANQVSRHRPAAGHHPGRCRPGDHRARPGTARADWTS